MTGSSTGSGEGGIPTEEECGDDRRSDEWVSKSGTSAVPRGEDQVSLNVDQKQNKIKMTLTIPDFTIQLTGGFTIQLQD